MKSIIGQPDYNHNKRSKMKKITQNEIEVIGLFIRLQGMIQSAVAECLKGKVRYRISESLKIAHSINNGDFQDFIGTPENKREDFIQRWAIEHTSGPWYQA